MKKIILLILLLSIYFSNNLFADDSMLLSSKFKLNQSEELIDVTFFDKSIYVISKYQKYIQGDMFVSNFIKIYEFDNDFNLIKDFEIENIKIDSIKYQLLPFHFNVENDTLIIIGNFVKQEQTINKYGHNIFVKKYFEQKEVFSNYMIVEDGLATSSYLGNSENLISYVDDKNIIIGIKGPEIAIRIYDIYGNYNKTQKILDDSVSNGFYGKEGEVYIKNLYVHNNQIHVILNKLTKVKNKNEYYLKIYDNEFNIINENMFTDNKVDYGIQNFNFDEKKILVFRELLPGVSTISNKPINYIYEVSNKGIDSISTIGINYPDEIYDIIPFNNGYLAVGLFNQLNISPFKTTLVQKLNSNFIIEESFTLYDDESNQANYAHKARKINDYEYLIVGFFLQEKMVYFVRLSTIMSVEENLDYNNLLYPNPTKENIILDFELDTPQQLEWQIIDLNGRELMANTVYFTQGKNKLEINVANLENGIYFLKVGNKTSKFIISK